MAAVSPYFKRSMTNKRRCHSLENKSAANPPPGFNDYQTLHEDKMDNVLICNGTTLRQNPKKNQLPQFRN